MRLMLLLGVLASVLGTADGRANDSHDDARQALEEGRVVPLAEILQLLQSRAAGEVLEVELERHGNRWIYEIETLSRDGVIAEHWVDAQTKAILSTGVEHDE
jgi:uncharacterized membrane protein YkoI